MCFTCEGITLKGYRRQNLQPRDFSKREIFQSTIDLFSYILRMRLVRPFPKEEKLSENENVSIEEDRAGSNDHERINNKQQKRRTTEDSSSSTVRTSELLLLNRNQSGGCNSKRSRHPRSVSPSKFMMGAFSWRNSHNSKGSKSKGSNHRKNHEKKKKHKSNNKEITEKTTIQQQEERRHEEVILACPNVAVQSVSSGVSQLVSTSSNAGTNIPPSPESQAFVTHQLLPEEPAPLLELDSQVPPVESLPTTTTEAEPIISCLSSSCHNSEDMGDDNLSHTSRGSTVSSKCSSTFKKESLRRSYSTCSVAKMMLTHSQSAIGLDEMIEDRREGGQLGQNFVHIEMPFGKPIEEVYDGIHNGPVLGSGMAGTVRLVTHKTTGLKYAVKVLDLGLVEKPTGLQQLREEICVMCQLDHPNIVRLEEVYESQTEIYLVQELCTGGELFDRLDEQPDYHYTEGECARLVKQMLSAVRYLHSKGIVHRDLKLENFLFSSAHPYSELKMIDFGLSKHFQYGEVQHETVGTPYTVAPEVIRGNYDERCDLWAIGVISFLLLSGESPFGGCGGPEPLSQVRTNILNASYAFEPADIWELVSSQARGFIRSLLVTDPNARFSAQQAQQHEWFQEWKRNGADDNNNSSNSLSPNVVRALVNFKEFSDMRKLLCEVLSFTLLSDQIHDLRREFEKMDTDGSGEISLAALKQVLMQNAGAGSLGALTEDEVTDIFDAMRVRKTETNIHWHEFLAAALSQCSVDGRNLRLAFERLDSDHKGVR